MDLISDHVAQSAVSQETECLPVESPAFNFHTDSPPSTLAYCCQEFAGSNFVKGAQWSSDGSTLLVSSNDRRARVFPLPEQFYSGDFSQPIPEMRSSVCVKEGGNIYDFCWYPVSMSEQSHCFFTSSMRAPIHMWSCIDGQLISTYRPINHLDELNAANSLAVSPDGVFLYSGFNKLIRIFDIERPGQSIDEIKTHKKKAGGQTGIVSCFAFHPDGYGFAAGNYDHTVGTYDIRSGKQEIILDGHSGGVTQLKFSPCGNLLITAARKDEEMIVWDMRNPGGILAILPRAHTTYQRVYFDIDPSGRYVCSGQTDGLVRIWDLNSICSSGGEERLPPTFQFKASGDCINSCSFHPTLAMIVTGSGQRRRTLHSYSHLSQSDFDSSSDSSSDQAVSRPPVEQSIRLWWLGS